jgi:hypothetical protein
MSWIESCKFAVNSLLLKRNLQIWAEIDDSERSYAKLPVNFPVRRKFASQRFRFAASFDGSPWLRVA